MNRIPENRIAQSVRACAAILLAFCGAFLQTTNGSSAADQNRPDSADLI